MGGSRISASKQRLVDDKNCSPHPAHCLQRLSPPQIPFPWPEGCRDIFSTALMFTTLTSTIHSAPSKDVPAMEGNALGAGRRCTKPEKLCLEVTAWRADP